MTNTTHTQSSQQKDTKPWYKQFWPWFLIALPASSVIAGITTVFIAFNNADSMVKDDYYKDGLAINQTLGKRERAQHLGIQAEARIEQQDDVLTLVLSIISEKPISNNLTIEFRHATLEHKDFVRPLQQRANGDYFAQLPSSIEGKWQVTLSPALQTMSMQPNAGTWELENFWILPSHKALTLGL
ncbi:MAG: FixH family protein [Kangiellaceae bacterium]|nr:FixH family protein [Kangiellaceae bacterium]